MNFHVMRRVCLFSGCCLYGVAGEINLILGWHQVVLLISMKNVIILPKTMNMEVTLLIREA